MHVKMHEKHNGPCVGTGQKDRYIGTGVGQLWKKG